ncbi:MAG TPA: cytochrome c [Bacteroidia bacterium]|nr:cytochrome c [Bacteroidia bacterium]
MTLRKFFPYILAVVVIYSCGMHATATPPATPEEGLFRTVCGKCHKYSKAEPSKHTPEQWVKIVDKMQFKKGKQQFTDEQKAQILVYIDAHAKKSQ